MITTWILVMWINGGEYGSSRAAIATIPFASEDACLKAQAKIIKKSQDKPLFLVCVEQQ